MMNDIEQTTNFNDPTISVVVPLYNEENNVRPLIERIERVFKQLGCHWELVFALDPSPDRTRERIQEFMEAGYPIRLITFARRIGKPLSLLAGLDHCRGDACVVIDADLQDPPELIEEMVQQWRKGFLVVLPQRISRLGESFFYLKAAELFYWLLERVSDTKVPRNTGDFRLMDARVVKEVCRFRERHGFLRGIVASVGFRTAVIPYSRDARLAGRTQIPFLGALNIALDGMIPFSRTPVRMMFVLGLSLMALGAATGLTWLLTAIFGATSVHWVSTMLVFLMLVLSGLIVACLGILGEYIVRTYEEARDRPLYVVESILEADTIPRKVSGPSTAAGGNP
jgi:polyisoprenyl-phosphate glycosyltransferase